MKMKAKKTIMIVLFLIALAFLSSRAYSQEVLAGCCCDFEFGLAQSAGFLPYTDCEAQYNFVLPKPDDIIKYGDIEPCTGLCAEKAEGFVPPEEPPPTGIGCGDVRYAPPPENIQAVIDERGERWITLFWDTRCPASYFDVYRCKGRESDCTSFEKLTSEGGWGEPLYRDRDPDLLWDQYYTYKIVANYVTSGESNGTTVEIYTGDIECWGKTTDAKFCLSKYFYNREDIKTYLENRGYGIKDANDFKTDFSTAVTDVFFNKFNKKIR